MKKRKKYPLVAAFDFDETIGIFKPNKKLKSYQTKSVTNIPYEPVLEFMKQLKSKGIKIVVYSSRWWGDYNSLVEWFNKHNIEVDDIILGRFKADLYVCDKSVNPHDENFLSKSIELLNETDSWGKHYLKTKRNRSCETKKESPSFFT